MVRSIAALPHRGLLACHCPRKLRPSRARGCVTSASADGAEHQAFLRRVDLEGPGSASLQALLRVLKAQGHTLVSPADRLNLHPLAVPLTRVSAPSGSAHAAVTSDEVYTCLMARQAGSASAGRFPLVHMSRGAPAVALLARSTTEYLHRALAEEDWTGGSAGAVADAAGEVGAALYHKGVLQQSKLPLPAYLTRKAGMYPDVAEQLVMNHLEKDDLMSALITGEWYTRADHFGGWGRPFEFNADLYHRVNRKEEARDSARIALRMPWWSLATGFQTVCGIAGVSGGAASVRQQMDESNVKSTLPPGVDVGTKTDAQIAASEADHIMNVVAAGEAAWDDVRADLSEQYKRAGALTNAALVIAH